MSRSIAVRDYMTKPLTVSSKVTVGEAAKVILANKISGIAVVDEDNRLVGMLSELDCLRSVVDAAYNDGVPGAALVSDVMTKTVEVNHPDEDIITVAASMLHHKQRRRPIVDDGKLVGQLTCRIILGAIQDFQDYQRR